MRDNHRENHDCEPIHALDRARAKYDLDMTDWAHNIEVFAANMLKLTNWETARSVQRTLSQSSKQHLAGLVDQFVSDFILGASKLPPPDRALTGILVAFDSEDHSSVRAIAFVGDNKILRYSCPDKWRRSWRKWLGLSSQYAWSCKFWVFSEGREFHAKLREMAFGEVIIGNPGNLMRSGLVASLAAGIRELD